MSMVAKGLHARTAEDLRYVSMVAYGINARIVEVLELLSVYTTVFVKTVEVHKYAHMEKYDLFARNAQSLAHDRLQRYHHH